MIDAAPPYLGVLLVIVQIACKNSRLYSVRGRYDNDLTDLSRRNWIAVPVHQPYIIERGRRAHGAGFWRPAAEIGRQQSCFRLPIALAQVKPGACGELAENLRREHFSGRSRVFQGRHSRYAFADKISVNRRRSTERSHPVAVYYRCELLRIKIIKVIDHDGAADEPLTVEFAP